MAADIVASLAALTGAFQDNGFGGSFELVESSFDGTQGPVGDILVSFEPITGDFTSPGNEDGVLDASFSLIAGSFTPPNGVVASLEQMTGSLTGLQGVIGSFQGTFEAFTPSFIGNTPYVGVLTGSLQTLTGSFAGGPPHTGLLLASLRPLQGTFTGLLGQTGTIVASLRPITAVFTGGVVGTGLLATSLPRILGYFSGGPAVDGTTLETWAMNTRTNAVTKYPAYPANSFARYNGTYLAAGPTGIYTLGGDLEADAAWKVRTGLLDDKKAGLKRMTEVLLGTRYDGPIVVRIWKDENTYYDYALPNIKQDVLQQVRAKIGRGLRSRYYKIELLGTGGRFELDSLQATMPLTTRRAG